MEPVVGKDALMGRVWPDCVVEENNLRVQIMALGRALGADRDLIRTVSGCGYQFTGEISTVFERPEDVAAAATAEAPLDPRGAQTGGRLLRGSPPTNLVGTPPTTPGRCGQRVGLSGTGGTSAPAGSRFFPG